MIDLDERFWSKIDKDPASGCWLWNASLNTGGYGHLKFGGRTMTAHRLSYRAAIGEISRELELDHLCRQRSCVNPDHLQAITHKENVLRGVNPMAVQARRTHCPEGHPLIDGNLVQAQMRRGRRKCLKCNRRQNRESYARRVTGSC